MNFINLLKKYWIVSALIAVLFLWFAFTCITYLKLNWQIQHNAGYLDERISAVLNKDLVTFQNIDAYLESDEQLDALKYSSYSIQNSTSINFIFSNRVDSLLAYAKKIEDRYKSHADGIQTVQTNVKDHHEQTDNVQNIVLSTFQEATNSLSVNTELSSIRSKMNSVRQERNNITQLKNSFKREISSTEINSPYNSVQIKIYNSFIEELEFQSVQLAELHKALEEIERYELNQQQLMNEVARSFYSSSGGINIVYKQFQPLTQNLSRQIKPVRDGVRILERSILPGFSALGLLRRVDPVSAQAISLISDVSTQIVRIENEINSLVRNILPMREISGRYSSNKTRQNAVQLQNQAKKTALYLEGKRNLFDPVYEKIIEADNQIARLNQAIYNINNANARNILLDFTGSASRMLNQVGQPIENYKSTINVTISDLKEIENLDDGYSRTIENFTSIEPKVFETSIVSQPSIQAYLSAFLNHKYFIIIVILGGAVIVGLITFVVYRNKPSKERNIQGSRGEGTSQSKKMKESEIRKTPVNFNLRKDEKEINQKKEADKEIENDPSLNVNISDTDYTDTQSENTVKNKIVEDSDIHQDDFNSFLNQDGDQTIVVEKSYRKSIPIPGFLLVLNGIQKNKKLKLYGGKTSNGIIITFGREAANWKQHVKAERQKSHIRISDSSRSLSRLQAQLIYKNGDLYIRNLSKSNPTKVDDYLLFGEEKIRLKPGAIIEAGYMKIQYIL